MLRKHKLEDGEAFTMSMSWNTPCQFLTLLQGWGQNSRPKMTLKISSHKFTHLMYCDVIYGRPQTLRKAQICLTNTKKANEIKMVLTCRSTKLQRQVKFLVIGERPFCLIWSLFVEIAADKAHYGWENNNIKEMIK